MDDVSHVCGTPVTFHKFKHHPSFLSRLCVGSLNLRHALHTHTGNFPFGLDRGKAMMQEMLAPNRYKKGVEMLAPISHSRVRARAQSAPKKHPPKGARARRSGKLERVFLYLFCTDLEQAILASWPCHWPTQKENCQRTAEQAMPVMPNSEAAKE